MKSVEELDLPEDYRYADDHEWAKLDGDKVRVGLDDYAQDQLGEIVYVELPQVGAVFQKGDVFGMVESVKAVSDCYMPVGGEVVAVNSALEDSPQLINQSPYDDGWMIDVKPADIAEMDTLYTREGILEKLKEGGEQ